MGGARERQKESVMRRKGRRWTMIAYFGLVVLVSAVCTIQISLQAFERPRRSAAGVDCRAGIRSLMTAIDRARETSNELSVSEADAVGRFRRAREPEWSTREDVLAACQGDEKLMDTLDAVLHLGFAEEHGVRREAIELLPFRRRARELVDTYAPADSRSAPPPR